ncbi:TPA: glycosyl hydrolase [Candidatus Sumerlaeota bacterium]|nr:glycosyl hydrolase [Candidatus Sumerlaeota bacterium]
MKIFKMMAVLATICAPILSSLLPAQEAGPSCCGRPVLVTGEFTHFVTPKDINLKGVDKPERFKEEVFGQQITAAVTGLEPGKYTIEVDLMEAYEKAAGCRVMTITAGDKTLAQNLDIFVAAGGYGKPYMVSGTVDHQGDALNGPVSVTFKGIESEAKFNTIRFKDAKGERVACIKAFELSAWDSEALKPPVVQEPIIYTNPDQPIDKRLDDLVRRMSLSEKVGQMQSNASPITRLGVPAYNYWNECLHGVARAGIATVFPQAIGMAATWDIPLIYEVGDTISTEGRAKHHEAVRKNSRNIYEGLTFWTPNINIFRDPRWGRGQETYGEDPFLTERLGVALIKGLQGNDPTYVKVMACAKHFAVHSGPESSRHMFDAKPSERDLYETYLPQFEAAVREAKVWNVMGAYNRLDGEPACSDRFLLQDLLRDKWGFKGHVVSDCGAIGDIYHSHKVVPTPEEAAARAVRAGCDLECGTVYNNLGKALKRGLITEAELDVALKRILDARFRLGMFDPPKRVKYAQIPYSENDSPAHQVLATKVARESMVLLKNNGVLPLNKAKIKNIAVIGANAASTTTLVGNYNGTPSNPIHVLQGIQDAVGKDVTVEFEDGSPLALKPDQRSDQFSTMTQRAVELAQNADVVIYVGGISPQLEGEEMRVPFEGFQGGDRTRIELPLVQTNLLRELKATGKPVVFVNCSGCAIAMPWEAENIPAILQAWYPGQSGGTAVADVLFGTYNPAGRLPVTFYKYTEDLPEFDDYSMTNRTYRYFTGKPLFAFGHGLSYTQFNYGSPSLSAKKIAADGSITLEVPIKNVGKVEGDEIVQLYVRHKKSSVTQPLKNLRGFERIHLKPGEKKTVTFALPATKLSYWDDVKHAYVVEPGPYEIQVGASSVDIRKTVQVIIK